MSSFLSTYISAVAIWELTFKFDSNTSFGKCSTKWVDTSLVKTMLQLCEWWYIVTCMDTLYFIWVHCIVYWCIVSCIGALYLVLVTLYCVVYGSNECDNSGRRIATWHILKVAMRKGWCDWNRGETIREIWWYQDLGQVHAHYRYNMITRVLWHLLKGNFIGRSQSLKCAWKKITFLILQPHLPGANELNASVQSSDEQLNSLWPGDAPGGDAMWWNRSGSTLAQVMTCWLTAPRHYLYQSCHIISKVQWHLSDGNFRRDTISYENKIENYRSKISFTYPRGQWV